MGQIGLSNSRGLHEPQQAQASASILIDSRHLLGRDENRIKSHLAIRPPAEPALSNHTRNRINTSDQRYESVY